MKKKAGAQAGGNEREAKPGLGKRLASFLSEKSAARKIQIVVLLLMVVLSLVVILESFSLRSFSFDYKFFILVPCCLVLLFSMVMKIYKADTFRKKIPWYVVDTVVLIVLTVFSDYAFLAYILVLSDYYISAPRLFDNFIAFLVYFLLFTVVYIIMQTTVQTDFKDVFSVSSAYFMMFVVFVLHFVIYNFSVVVLRKNRQIEENLKELEKNRSELLQAYDKVEETAVFEERNRIAKDIHDTVGHSITAIIMQTEAARVNLDRDPEKARECLSAANLQAKMCLEQMRESVHLLSGNGPEETLKDGLEKILTDTAAGTDLKVRSRIEDIALVRNAERFLMNTLRECLSNAVRHGGGTAFLVELSDRGSWVEFFFSDNGSGTDMQDFREGFGLSGMRARTEYFGGMINFSSAKGEGFEITISLPASLKRTERETAEEERTDENQGDDR